MPVLDLMYSQLELCKAEMVLFNLKCTEEIDVRILLTCIRIFLVVRKHQSDIPSNMISDAPLMWCSGIVHIMHLSANWLSGTNKDQEAKVYVRISVLNSECHGMESLCFDLAFSFQPEGCNNQTLHKLLFGYFCSIS